MSVRKQAKHVEASPVKPFCGLPNEIIRHVFTFCDTRTLCNARLGCSTWAYEVIGAFLFDTVTLIDHMYFLDRFIYAFRLSPLRLRIRKLVIDERWKDQLVMLHNLHQDGVIEYDPYHRASPAGHTLDILYQRYRTCQWTAMLRHMLSDAFNAIYLMLKSVVSVEIDSGICPYETDHWEDPEMTETLRRCSPKPAAYRAFLSRFGIEDEVPIFEINRMMVGYYYLLSWPKAQILTKMAPQLQELVLKQFTTRCVGEDMSGIDSPQIWELGPVLNNIPYLDMRLSSDVCQQGPKLRESTTRMLRSARNLLSLRLQAHHTLPCCLEEMDCPWEGYCPRKWEPHIECLHILSYLLAEQAPAALPSLKSLWLHNVVCTSGEIEHFLAMETPKLQHFTLSNGMLLEESEGENTRACWITTLQSLRSRLCLKAVDFGGYLTNLGRQHWHITEGNPQAESVKGRMIDWFLDKGMPRSACPLDVFELTEGKLDTMHEDDVLHAATDESWSMFCPQRELLVQLTDSNGCDYISLSCS